MAKAWNCAFLILAVLGCSQSVDVSFNQRGSAYFIRSPFFSRKTLKSEDVQQEHFILSKPQHVATVKASYGPFETQGTIIVNTSKNSSKPSSQGRVAFPGGDISVYVINGAITQGNPTIQVLGYASHVSRDSYLKSSGHKKRQKWCIYVHVQKNGKEATSSCELQEPNQACIVQVTLPRTWWSRQQETQADIYYSIDSIDYNLHCTINSIVPQKSQKEMGSRKFEHVKHYLSTVGLSRSDAMPKIQRSYTLFTRKNADQHVLVDVPNDVIRAGTRFNVPIFLQAESDLRQFFIRVKARHGLRIITAHSSDPTTWDVELHLNHKQKGALVKAVVKDDKQYTKKPSVQEIFVWTFEADRNIPTEEVGRLIFNIEYNKSGAKRTRQNDLQVSRVVARIHLRQEEPDQIIPVIQSTELINTAILTGKRLSFPLKIFAISTNLGIHKDVTVQCKCVSEEKDVIKVDPLCKEVYLDGSEVKASADVSVTLECGSNVNYLHFKVWIPEHPLELVLSDTKLSQIKSWKVSKSNPRIKRDNRDREPLTHPELIDKQDESRIRSDPGDGGSTACHLRYQQTLVEVFARFYIPSKDKNIYLPMRKASLRITDLIAERLRISDTSIASLNGQVVEGKKLGRTEIQVLSPSGRVIGAKEIRVGSDKVTIDSLLVSMVTNLSVSISTSEDVDNTFVANIGIQEQLHRKYQEGMLDISVVFDDQSVMPLRYFSPNDFVLDVASLNNHVIAVGPKFSSSQPKVIAVGQGKGELIKVMLHLPDSCQRKKSRPLAVNYVYVNVDFTKADLISDKFQNDGHHFVNRPSDHWNLQTELEKDILHIDLGKKYEATKNPIGNKVTKQREKWEIGEGIPLDIDISELPQQDPPPPMEVVPTHEDAQPQQITKLTGMTPLEIGMYVLLAVFCVAIIVFFVNCIVFVVKYKRKRVPKKENAETVANAADWVWIGRTTLERNAVNTQCSQTLMPKADFDDELKRRSSQTIPDPGVRNSIGNASNRSSAAVSTYKGSECSIRITTNPLPDGEDGEKKEEEEKTTSDDKDNDSREVEGTEAAPLLPPEGQEETKKAAPIAKPENFEWDYESMGMSYDQLMEYFDNLKESSA